MDFNRFYVLQYRLIDSNGLTQALLQENEMFPGELSAAVKLVGGVISIVSVSANGDATQIKLGTAPAMNYFIKAKHAKFFAPIEPEPMCIEAVPPVPNPFEEIHDNIIQFPRKNRVMVASTPTYHPPQMTYGATEGVERRLPTPIEAFKKHYPGQDWSLDAVAARAA